MENIFSNLSVITININELNSLMYFMAKENQLLVNNERYLNQVRQRKFENKGWKKTSNKCKKIKRKQELQY